MCVRRVEQADFGTRLICLSGTVLLRQGLIERSRATRRLVGSSIPGYIRDHNPGIRSDPFNLALYHPTTSIERGKQDYNLRIFRFPETEPARHKTGKHFILYLDEGKHSPQVFKVPWPQAASYLLKTAWSVNCHSERTDFLLD
jgi:hypothetical protein